MPVRVLSDAVWLGALGRAADARPNFRNLCHSAVCRDRCRMPQVTMPAPTARARPIFSKRLSLLAPGQGLRRAPFSDLARGAAATAALRSRRGLTRSQAPRISARGSRPGQARESAAAGSCGSTARRSRARACSPTISRSSGSRRRWTGCSRVPRPSGGVFSIV